MQTIISKGKDINEAIKLGCELLETTKQNVNIEIIEHGTKGFFGLKSKGAIVKLTKNQPKFEPVVDDQSVEQLIKELSFDTSETLKSNNETSTTSNETKIDDLAGKAWVKNGKLFFKSSPTHFPMVTIKEGIKLYKNNEQIDEKTIILSELYDYTVVVDHEEKETRWKVSMDEHKLKVQLSVEPGYKMIRNVADMEADYHIELHTVEIKENLNTLSYAEVIEKLEVLRIKHGFNQAEIVKAIEATNPGTYEIANGISPKQGKDGWIELKVNINVNEGIQEKEDGRVDFREIKSIPKVNRGQVLGIVHPPLPGQIGYTVTNEPVPAKQTFPIILRPGSGVVLVEDKIVATESGRPLIEQRGQLVKASIMQKLSHVGNVDLSTGNIRFKGDVEIMGEVQDKMIVEAGGDIFVQKTINNAAIIASGAVSTFGSVIGSEISAGKNNMLISELGHLLGTINQTVEKMIELIKQLILSPAFKSNDFSRGGLQPLIRILLEKKFKTFPKMIKKYVEVVNRGESYLQDDTWRQISVSLSRIFLSLTNEVMSIEGIEQLSIRMKKLHELSRTPVEPDSYITIPNAHNSRLYCSGNILILGQGCVNTKIHAGGTLKISGIIRGGEVYGRLGVEINEVGAESGTATVIAVPSDQKILLQKVLEGTVIKIGNVKHTFKETKYRVRARLDENERMIFE